MRLLASPSIKQCFFFRLLFVKMEIPLPKIKERDKWKDVLTKSKMVNEIPPETFAESVKRNKKRHSEYFNKRDQTGLSNKPLLPGSASPAVKNPITADQYMQHQMIVRGPEGIPDEMVISDGNTSLARWHPDLFPDQGTCLIVGGRGTGKTTVEDYIAMNVRQRYPFVYCFTATKASGYWQRRIPESFIYDGYKPAILEKIMDKQKLLKKNDNTVEIDGLPRKINPLKLIIFDDVTDGSLFREKLLTKLAYEGRHLNLACILAIHDYKTVSPSWRDSTDVLVLMEPGAGRTIEDVHSRYMVTKSRKEATDFIVEIVDDPRHPHRALVIQKRFEGQNADKATIAQQNSLSRFYWAEAPNMSKVDYKLGSLIQWHMEEEIQQKKGMLEEIKVLHGAPLTIRDSVVV